jgi:hypothetical protein
MSAVGMETDGALNSREVNNLMYAPFLTDQILVQMIISERLATQAWLTFHEEMSVFFSSPRALLFYAEALRYGLRPGLREGFDFLSLPKTPSASMSRAQAALLILI